MIEFINLFRARYYDPSTGRFLSEDPIHFAGGDVNLYRYVGNSPVVYRDPSGRWALPILAVIGSGLANALGSAAGTYIAGGSRADMWSAAQDGFIAGAATGAMAIGSVMLGLPPTGFTLIGGIAMSGLNAITDSVKTLGGEGAQGHVNFINNPAGACR